MKLKVFFAIFNLTFLVLICFYFDKVNQSYLKDKKINYNFTKTNKKVLYLSIHSGTIDEMIFVFNRNKINFNVSSLGIFKNFGYRISQESANKIIESNLVKNICDKFDVIMIGDTIPLGRPFYQASPQICKSKIVLQITNRFDFQIEDTKKYINLIRSLVNNTNVYWVPNNNFELYYINLHEIYPNSNRLIMIKPYGISFEPKKQVKIRKTIIYTQFLIDIIKNTLKKMNVSNESYEIYSKPKYGGPLTLRGNKLFVYIPYQFSTMKVFQNANYNVLTAIPTPQFYKKIISDSRYQVLGLIGNLLDNNPEWELYFDVYQPNYIEMYIQFNSWLELADLIKEKNINTLRARSRNRMKKVMKNHWNENDQKWNQLFRELLNTS